MENACPHTPHRPGTEQLAPTTVERNGTSGIRFGEVRVMRELALLAKPASAMGLEVEARKFRGLGTLGMALRLSLVEKPAVGERASPGGGELTADTV